MPVPIADPFSHRVAAVEQLHEADVSLQQSPSENTIPRETRLAFVLGVVGAVGSKRGRRLVREIRDLCSRRLQSRRHLVTGNPGSKFQIAGSGRQMLVVELAEEVASCLIGS